MSYDTWLTNAPEPEETAWVVICETCGEIGDSEDGGEPDSFDDLASNVAEQTLQHVVTDTTTVCGEVWIEDREEAQEDDSCHCRGDGCTC